MHLWPNYQYKLYYRHKYLAIAALVITYILLLITGCALGDSGTAGRECHMNPIPITPTNDTSRLLLFVLVEGTPTYHQSGKFERATTMLSDILPDVMEPGDHLLVAWLEAKHVPTSLATVVFINEEIRPIGTPDLPTLPILPTITPSVPPSRTPQTDSGRDRATNTAIAEETRIWSYTNAQNCELSTWQAEYQKTLQSWQANREATVTAFVKQIDEEFPTPDNPQAQQTFETLSLAAGHLSQECSTDKYQHCVLLIFSDMRDWRREWATQQVADSLGGSIDLSNVAVAVVLLQCPFLDGQCGVLKEDWVGHFSNFNAPNIYIIPSTNAEEELTKNLNSYIRR